MHSRSDGALSRPLFNLLSLAAFVLIMSAVTVTCGWSQHSLEFVGEITFNTSAAGCSSTDSTGGSDVWGYTAPDGTEYALMGVKRGIAVVRIPDMTKIKVQLGPQFGDCWWHRDIKTYDHYAYAVAEMAGTNAGLMILDLQFLPDSVHYVGSYVSGVNTTSHNMSIDVANGYAYVGRSNASGVRIISLADPENPVDVGSIVAPSVHDVFARNDTAWVAEGWNGSFSIWDVSNKASPQILARLNVPSAGYAHNVWPFVGSDYMLTTEETASKTVKVWDTQNLMGITKVGDYLGANSLAHNVQVEGDFAFLSHYSYGLSVLDLSNPSNPVEVAHYDTYLADDNPGFWGCWGVYPHNSSRYVYASDFRGYLTVLRFVDTATDVAGSALPGPAALSAGNEPNPFNPTTRIRYTTPSAGALSVNIFNPAGRLVRTVYDGFAEAGDHSVQWDGLNDTGQEVPSGKYFYRVALDGDDSYEVTRPMMLVR